MTRPLAQPPPALELPPGVELRAYQDEDEAEFLRVNNAAFADHPENGGWGVAKFAERREREWFDPEGLLMAWRGDRLVGFHWTKWHGHATDERPAHEPVGEVYVLAVAPSERGTGLGRALLLAGLRHLHGRGCREAILYVDRENHPAVRLYESEGFSQAYVDVCYEQAVPPGRLWAAELLRPA